MPHGGIALLASSSDRLKVDCYRYPQPAAEGKGVNERFTGRRWPCGCDEVPDMKGLLRPHVLLSISSAFPDDIAYMRLA
jgi:hypothetical protein